MTDSRTGRESGEHEERNDPEHPVRVLGRRLQEARRRRGWTYRDMEKFTGISKSTLHYMVRSRQSAPDYYELRAIVEKLGEQWNDDWERLWRLAVGADPVNGNKVQTTCDHIDVALADPGDGYSATVPTPSLVPSNRFEPVVSASPDRLPGLRGLMTWPRLGVAILALGLAAFAGFASSPGPASQPDKVVASPNGCARVNVAVSPLYMSLRRPLTPLRFKYRNDQVGLHDQPPIDVDGVLYQPVLTPADAPGYGWMVTGHLSHAHCAIR